MKDRIAFSSIAWPEVANTLGFSAPDENGVRALNGFALRSEGDWLALVDRGPEPKAPLPSGLGAPGLWRVVQNGTGLARVHDLPLLRGVNADGDSGEVPFAEHLSDLVGWASATQKGDCVRGWKPPAREEVESWFAPARLRLRSGSLLAKGELVHETNRMALVFPELASVPEELSRTRMAWLEDFLLDAQRHWRLVRFGIDAETRAVRAEVDLSGVPLAWARSLVQLALEALAWAVVWVLSPLSFLVDTNANSRALDRHSLHSLKRSTST